MLLTLHSKLYEHTVLVLSDVLEFQNICGSIVWYTQSNLLDESKVPLGLAI